MPKTDNILKTYVKMYNESVEVRLRSGNRLRKSGGDQEIKELIGFANKKYRAIEYKLKQKIEIRSMKLNKPTYEWLTSFRGIGSVMAGGLIAYVGDITQFKDVQHLWAYAGMKVIEVCDICKKKYIHDGYRGAWIQHTAERLKEQNDKVTDPGKKKKGVDFIKDAESKLCHCEQPIIRRISDRKMAGQLLDYDPDFKQLCYLLGDQFVKQRDNPYRQLYDQFRLEYENRPDLMKERDERKSGTSKGTGHIHDMARRKTVKILLSHLWEVMSELKGIDVKGNYHIYSFAVLGHHDKIEPFRV